MIDTQACATFIKLGHIIIHCRHSSDTFVPILDSTTRQRVGDGGGSATYSSALHVVLKGLVMWINNTSKTKVSRSKISCVTTSKRTVSGSAAQRVRANLYGGLLNYLRIGSSGGSGDHYKVHLQFSQSVCKQAYKLKGCVWWVSLPIHVVLLPFGCLLCGHWVGLINHKPEGTLTQNRNSNISICSREPLWSRRSAPSSSAPTWRPSCRSGATTSWTSCAVTPSPDTISGKHNNDWNHAIQPAN